MKPSKPVYSTIISYGLDAARRRVESITSRQNDTGCWQCTLTPKPKGYCVIRFGKLGLLAHRVAWALANNADPGEFLVCHTCDNRECINPDHLFLGTEFDNHADMVRKGRRIEQTGKRRRVVGPKLTCEQAQAIKNDTRPRPLIAAEYGISIVTVGNIRAGMSWGPKGRDRTRKGRSSFGEAHPNSKLTAAQAAEIYQSLEPDSYLAHLYGVSERTVRFIRDGVRWKAATSHLRIPHIPCWSDPLHSTDVRRKG